MHRRRSTKKIEIAGKKFGRLCALKYVGLKNNHRRYLCRCDCGKTKVVYSYCLRYGLTTSCGCYHLENLVLRSTKHGMHGTSIYFTWAAMKQRCYNKKNCNYPRYGARGIRVYRKWIKSFAAFYADVGDRPSPRHQLDRKNNSKGYFPKNVRWVLPRINASNTRRNRLLTFKGETKTVSEWARDIGVKSGLIFSRIHRSGHSDEKALTMPVRQKNK